MFTDNQPELNGGSTEEVVETSELDKLKNGNGREIKLTEIVRVAAEELATELEAIALRFAEIEEEETPSSDTHTVSMVSCDRHGVYANVETSTLKVKVVHKGAKRETVVMCPGGHAMQADRQKVFGTHGGNIRRITPH